MISDNARAGMQQAPARSLFNALGFTPEERIHTDTPDLVNYLFLYFLLCK